MDVQVPTVHSLVPRMRGETRSPPDPWVSSGGLEITPEVPRTAGDSGVMNWTSITIGTTLLQIRLRDADHFPNRAQHPSVTTVAAGGDSAPS